MITLPSPDWLRRRLAPDLDGAAGDAFIRLLQDESTFQRLAFNLGYEFAMATLSEPPGVVRYLRPPAPAAQSDADELLEPTRFASATDVDTADTDPPPSAA